MEQCLAICDEVGATGLELLHRRLDFLDALQRFGMGGQPVGHAFAVACGLVQPAQCRQHPRNTFRIPSTARLIPHAQPVCLQLVVAAILQEKQPQCLFRDLSERACRRDKDAETTEKERSTNCARVLSHRVPRRDVPDLVPEHTGKLRFVIQKRQDPARDVDEAAGQRERIHCRLIHNRELPRKVRPFRELGELQADAAHVLLQRRVLVDPYLGFYLGVGFAAQGDLLGLAHQRELALAGDGVRRACRGDRRHSERCGPKSAARVKQFSPVLATHDVTRLAESDSLRH